MCGFLRVFLGGGGESKKLKNGKKRSGFNINIEGAIHEKRVEVSPA